MDTRGFLSVGEAIKSTYALIRVELQVLHRAGWECGSFGFCIEPGGSAATASSRMDARTHLPGMSVLGGIYAESAELIR